MRQIFAVVLSSLLIISCNEQVETDVHTNNKSGLIKEVTSPTEINKTVDDPTFVLARDTISTHGPRSITRNILQDKKGNIWFATWEGIIQYDGKLFTNVTLKQRLRHFRIFSILECRNGNLWFGTMGGGAYRYDGESFTLFTTEDGLADNKIVCMLEGRDGNIWFGTSNGVSRYNGNTFTNFTVENGISNNFIYSITQDKNGKLWFGTRGTVSCYDPYSSIWPGGKPFTGFTIKDDLYFHGVHSVISDKAGNIWIASDEGLFRYDGKSLVNVSKKLISCIFEDHAGNLWVSENEVDGKSMALSMYNGNSFTTIKVHKQIFGITEDTDENIWFGTTAGAQRYDGKSFNDFSN